MFAENKSDTTKKQTLQRLYDEYFENNNCLYSIEVGQVLDGVIVDFIVDGEKNIAVVDVKFSTDIFVNVNKENSDFNYNIGDSITLQVTSKNDNEIFASEKSYFSTVKKEQVFATINDGKTAFEVKITEVVNTSGFMVELDEFTCFMPASLASANRVSNFDEMIGKKLHVMVVNYTENGMFIVSHKHYLKQLVPMEIEKLKKGQIYTGIVTGTASFGVFAEFNDFLTGMIHKNDLDLEWTKRFNENKIKPGDVIEFRIKYTKDNKIVLTQNTLVDCWTNIHKFFKVGDTYKGKIIRKLDNSTLIELRPGVRGLCYGVLEEAEETNLKVKITHINKHKRHIFLNKQ